MNILFNVILVIGKEDMGPVWERYVSSMMVHIVYMLEELEIKEEMYNYCPLMQSVKYVRRDISLIMKAIVRNLMIHN